MLSVPEQVLHVGWQIAYSQVPPYCLKSYPSTAVGEPFGQLKQLVLAGPAQVEQLASQGTHLLLELINESSGQSVLAIQDPLESAAYFNYKTYPSGQDSQLFDSAEDEHFKQEE